jgi:hybrid cluster-associated redox disulfide protein
MVKKKLYILKKDTLISDILRDCPQALEYLAEYGLLCVTCPLNQFDTLESGTKVHRMSAKVSKKMIDEINNKLKKDYEKLNN